MGRITLRQSNATSAVPVGLYSCECVSGGPIRWDMKIKRFPAGFVVPTQPIKPSSPSDAGWVHEIKDDGYRLIVRRGGPKARLYAQRK